MNIKLLAISAITSIVITALLFFSGIITISGAMTMVYLTAILVAALLVTKLIGYVNYPSTHAPHPTVYTPLYQAALPRDNKITYTNLHDATSNGSLVEVEHLLNAAGTDVNATNQEGNTPLHRAAIKGNTEIAKALIARGANVNATDLSEWTPLHWAVVKNHIEIIDSLITAGADINASCRVGFTPLYHAISDGKIEIVKKLIQAGLNIAQPGGNYWMPYPLHLAISKGHMDIAQLCIDKGANIEATPTSDSNKTPMSIAIEENQPSIVDLLIKKGAFLHGRYLHDALFRAKNTDIAKQLIQNGVDIHTTDADDNTTLMAAAMEGHIEIVKLLIQAGANVHYTSRSHHCTALHVAAMSDHVEIIKLLIEAEADVNAAIPQESPMYGDILEEYPQINLNNISLTPLSLAIIDNKKTTALTIIHYGKVPYADIPVIENNPTSEYIMNLSNKSLIPLMLAIIENQQTTALTIIHYGKVPSADITVIENNPTSEYIQRQYQLATTPLERTDSYARGLFTGMKPSPKDVIMTRIKIFVQGTGAKGTYPLLMKLLYNGRKIPADLINVILEHAGLLPQNMNLNTLMIYPRPSSGLLSAEATTCNATHASATSVNTPKPL